MVVQSRPLNDKQGWGDGVASYENATASWRACGGCDPNAKLTDEPQLGFDVAVDWGGVSGERNE